MTECRTSVASTATVSERFAGAFVPSDTTAVGWSGTFSVSTGKPVTYTSPEAVFADEIKETGISALPHLVSVRVRGRVRG